MNNIIFSEFQFKHNINNNQSYIRDYNLTTSQILLYTSNILQYTKDLINSKTIIYYDSTSQIDLINNNQYNYIFLSATQPLRITYSVNDSTSSNLTTSLFSYNNPTTPITSFSISLDPSYNYDQYEDSLIIDYIFTK